MERTIQEKEALIGTLESKVHETSMTPSSASIIEELKNRVSEYEKEIDQMGDHQRHILCDVLEEMDALDGLLREQRLNRKRILEAVNNIRQIVNREL